LLCALIEARSCERFKALSENLEEQELRDFYRDLMVSEAGHYRLFIDLAKEFWPENKVKEKFQFYLEQEAIVLSEMDLRGDRVH
jgi:tRNA 2-(methylsulfanyl)-N6-isopentenyladenosine37 hydroxylase